MSNLLTFATRPRHLRSPAENCTTIPQSFTTFQACCKLCSGWIYSWTLWLHVVGHACPQMKCRPIATRSQSAQRQTPNDWCLYVNTDQPQDL